MSALDLRLRQLIIETWRLDGVRPDDISEETHFEDDLGADHDQMRKLFRQVDVQLLCRVPEEDRPRLTTYGRLRDYIKNNTGSGGQMP
ncbi:acyl carrier protein [Streptoalloteichus tenebrarius]|uniref:Acyl carrier protein n=1 Tax=Streptoalloteichus tenebrarius (strain ATCC 17920 / DSM 40477 / JCM 4838 / CBS 697.72 / NBRC 16177 / NCIMB 11028 / NRRL B-12390 / A12253. 1 / ISP 5477) TaxID=1933 RepID=A0ABT1HQY3_STRSD|nr:hypothetical protein [Streptoalloteichus tenebrarius]MCP2257913.1 acyl carrier protein [Streptoalloteichus tenebrarius]BFE99722.1 hypothetical protein GCM10020241_13980 [Streptoalloteichus tenebrarius]